MFANDIFKVQKSEIQYIGNTDTFIDYNKTEKLPF